MPYSEHIGKHQNYPGTLGETNPGQVSEAACPPLTLRTVDPTTVAFEPLQTQMFDVTLVATGTLLGDPEVVTVESCAGGEIKWGGPDGPPTLLRRGATFRVTEDIPAGTYQIREQVNAATAAQILDIEREHKNDAEYAYEQTIKRLADGVAGLRGRPFTGADEAAARRAALKALAEAVGERFVPAYPMVPGNWSTLARQHCMTLAEQSKKRDTDGNHRASWTAIRRGNNLYLVPVVPEVRRAPSEVLKLDELPVATPDWIAEAPPSCPFAPRQAVVVQTELNLPSGKVPVGWRGTFSGDNSDALGSQFVFLLYAPDDDPDNEREFTVPPDQLGSLRPADPPTPPSAPVTYTSPFRVDDKVKVTSDISTSLGVIRAGAIGEFFSDDSTATHVGSFSFPAVLREDGRVMASVMISRTDLKSLQGYDEPLPGDDTDTDDTGFADLSHLADELAQMGSESPPPEGQTDDTGFADLSHLADELAQAVNESLQAAGETINELLQAAGETAGELQQAAGKTIDELAAAFEEAIRKVRDKLPG